MKSTEKYTNYFFVDESGDPTFYDRRGNLIVGQEGVSPLLILGFIKTVDPEPLRASLLDLSREVSEDGYLQDIPSIKKTSLSFHAKDDCPEIREKVFKTIVNLDFTAEIFVARKIQNIFNSSHHRNENEFYFDLMSRLFENKLHLAERNKIYFAVRGNKSRQLPLEKAIQKAILAFELKCGKKINSRVDIYPQSPFGEPCLQIIDYVNWAVQRAYIKKESRYYKFIDSKIKYLVDLYDIDKYPKNHYSNKNRFDIEKISPL